MLSVLEHRLEGALSAALAGVPVVAGPSTGPLGSEQERVEVSGTLLTMMPPKDDDWAAARGPSFLLSFQRWAADGATLDFALPAGVDGEIVEVEAPSGFTLRPGDDYIIDGRIVRFYAPPAAGADAVVATLRGARASGFSERRPAELRAAITAWAAAAPRADELLARALTAGLAASVTLGNLEAPPVDTGVRRRLLRPTLALLAIERGAALVGTRPFVKASAALCARGELETTVALGAAPRPHTIDTILYGKVKLR